MIHKAYKECYLCRKELTLHTTDRYVLIYNRKRLVCYHCMIELKQNAKEDRLYE